MILRDISLDQFSRSLHSRHFGYQIGPFTVRLYSDVKQVAALFYRLYADCTLAVDPPIADFHMQLERPRNLRRWYRPQVYFRADGETPFAPFALDTAFPLLEWGFNWCIATRAHQYLMLHSAVVEKNGLGVLLPAWPGSGKSTLCAALVHRGWRLLSDEFGLVKPDTTSFVPCPRSIPLKNESIGVIRRFAPQAVLGPTFPKTRKGSVAHVKPPADSVARANEAARARFVVFPQFDAGNSATLKTLAKSRAFMKLAGNSFNYKLLGESGFRTVARIIDASDCYLFPFGDLDQAIGQLDELTS